MKLSDMDRLEVTITNFKDVILARQKIRDIMSETGFSILDQTRVITAVSELARNILVHAELGKMRAWLVSKDRLNGIRCEFSDDGPGIADVQQALTDGYSTSNSLGLGLGGSRRLCAEFEITTQIGQGTTVTITEWIKK